jgi:hypothetical protein
MTDNEIKARESMMAQLHVLQARVACRQTRILSGMYKTREVRIGGHEGRLLTEAELLKDEFQVMEAHIKMMQDIQDELAPSEND